tara:strand:- start:196 stop:642 length:447 start_codon:yes stop_codon:yes gene_type:complete
MRHINADGLAIIKKWEGWRESPYLCSASRWTIGWGSTWDINGAPIRPDHGNITRKEGEALLRREMRHVETAIDRLIPSEMTDNMHGAVCSFAYNLGTGALQRSTLRSMILRGAYEDAADQFLRWVRAGGRILRGLQLRRAEERELFLS